MLLPRDLLARCARNYPNKMAYTCGQVSRTWQEMDERSTRLAIALSESGIGRGDTVAILGQESLAIYEHFFACMKLGAVRLGLNWRYSTAELQHLLQDSRARALLVDARCTAQLEPIRGQLERTGLLVIGYGPGHGLAMDYEAMLSQAHAGPGHAWPGIAAQDVLMLTYTSGPAGRPKGVMHKQSSIAAMIFQSLVARGLGPDDIWYTAAASSWMTVVLNLLGLGNGMGHLICDGAFEIRSFLLDIQRHRATAVMLVPTLIQRALDEIASHPYDLSSIRLLMYGSAPATPELIRAAYAAFGCEMVQSYGMTEAGWTTQLSASDHRWAIEHEPGLLRSAGRAGVMSEIEIRDEAGQPLPAGSAGNVWIRSETVMKGYLNLPEETAEVLRGDWLCTNDVGHLDARGYLFLTDRRKFMIISGAVNIFPSSVENALLEHVAVAEAAVVGAPHPQWGEAVVAVVRLHEQSSASIHELQMHCESRLNRMERPKHFLFVEEFPKGMNGKLQKQQVKEWVAAQLASMPWNDAANTQTRPTAPQL